MSKKESRKLFIISGLGQSKDDWNKFESIYKGDLLIPEFTSEKNVDIFSDLFSQAEIFLLSQKEKVDLCGLSLGAIIAIKLAILHPNKINKLIIIAGQINPSKLLIDFQNFIFKIMPETFFKKLPFTKTQMIQITSELKWLNLSNEIKQLSLPTLVVIGEKDRANKKAAQEIHKEITNSKFHTLKGGHELNKDCPVELSELIESFVSNTY